MGWILCHPANLRGHEHDHHGANLLTLTINPTVLHSKGPAASLRSGLFACGSHNQNRKEKRLMAIKLIGNYAKRLGLPGYSSHQFSVSVETELSDSGDIQGEAARIYQLLQDAVDREIQTVGFVPGDEYGIRNGNDRSHPTGNGKGNGTSNGNGSHNGNGRTQYRIDDSNGSNGHSDRWSCSDKQKTFIEKLIDENKIDPATVEQISQDRFGFGMRQLNKLQASGLISELLEVYGKSRNGKGGRQ